MNLIQTQIERLSSWLAEINYDEFPSDVIEHAKYQALDCISAICSGSRSIVGKKVQEAIFQRGETGDIPVFPSMKRLNMYDAVYYHSSMINALEMDNFSFMGHLSQSAFSACWALTIQKDKSGKDFLKAFVLSQEVSGRLSAYLSSGPLQGHMRSFVHRIAGAVVYSVICQLNKEQIANAIAISLSGPELLMFSSSFSADTKVTSTSAPTIEGIRAGELAEKDFIGTLDIIEHPAGFLASFSYSNHAPEFWNNIGKTWVMRSISFKEYSGCAYAQAAINSGIEIFNQLGAIDFEKINEIVVYVPLLSFVMENFSVPHYKSKSTQVNINFSVKKSLALSLLFGKPDGNFFSSVDYVSKFETIEKLSSIIRLSHDWNLSVEMIRGFDKAIINPGYKGVFGMNDSQKTLKKYAHVYGNRSLFSWNDLSQLLNLPKGQLRYLLKRYYNSLMGAYIYKSKCSYEENLEDIEFKLSAHVKIRFKDGKEINKICSLPNGFAGDEKKIETVLKKYKRESEPVLGCGVSEKLNTFFMNIDSKKSILEF